MQQQGVRRKHLKAPGAFYAHSNMLRSLSLPEATAQAFSDSRHVLPLYHLVNSHESLKLIRRQSL